MIKNSIFILIFYFFTSFAFSQNIENIKIEGNKRVSEETIKIYGEISLEANYDEKKLNQIIKNLYSTNFFEDVNVLIQNNTLKVFLKEYPVVNQLIIFGEKSNKFKEKIKDIINTKSKNSFIKSMLSKDIELIKNMYSSNGYNFTKVEAKVKNLDDDKLDLIISIDRGNKTKISSITFIGNNYLRSNRLKDIIASEENKFWKFLSNNVNFTSSLLELDKRLLVNYYKSLGFYDVKVQSNIAEINEAGEVDIRYSIDEGERIIINKITTNLDDVFNKETFLPLNKIYKEYIGQYYSPFKIKKILDDIDLLISANNLQFVEHNVQEEVLGDKISITFNIFEGEKILVERINIFGNNITNEDVIRGELILDEGDPFTKLNLDKSVAEIKNRNIFKSVTTKVKDGSKKNLKVVDITVEEQPTGEISAGAGVGTNGGSFAIDVKENNWLGQGKGLSFSLDLDEESVKGTINYNDPNYNLLGNSLNYSLSNSTNDVPDRGYENSLLSAAAGTSFEQYKDVDVFLGLEVNYDDLRTDDTASATLKKQAGTYSELAANYRFTLDKRNRVFDPTDGHLISFGQSLPVYADSAAINNTLQYNQYHMFSENFIGSTKFYFSAINGLGEDDVRLSKRKSISTRRLRGFEKNKIGPVDGSDHIGGNYASTLSFEGSLPNLLPEDTGMDLRVFLDFGNLWGVDFDSSIDDSNEIRSSTGVSANWRSPLGPITFTLAQNLLKADTDETEGFSFNLGTTF